MRHFLFVASFTATLGSALAFAASACGGSVEDAAVVAPSDDAAAASSTSSTSSGATTSSSGSSGTTSSSSGAASSSGGSTSGSGGVIDGGVKEASTVDGGSTGATPNAVACGTTTCTSPGQKCCTTFQRGQGVTSTCIAATADCQGAQQRCDDKADCPANQICCAGGGPGSFGATCQATCNGIQMCKAANECTDGGTCQTYTCFGRQVSLCRKPQGCQ